MGCGSDSQPASPAGDAGAVQVAALGDSITSGSPGYDPDKVQRVALGFGHDERSQYEYWANQAEPSLEFSNCGVFGERTDQIATRLDDCAKGADALIVQGGINDIAQGTSIEAAADNLRSMVKSGKQLGLDVYLVDVLPWNNGHPQFDDAILDLNRRINAIGRDEGVTVIGFHDALEDPRQGNVMPIALTADGDHPSIAGYHVLGKLVARELTN